MITKTQLNILSVFNKDIFDSLTFKQIKIGSEQKSNNIVQMALKEFQKQNIIRANKVGDVTIYALNLKDNLALSYLNLINELAIAKSKLPKSILGEIQNRISKHTEFFIFIVFGSHAKNKTSAKSDLDIAVIVESEQTKKEISPYIETIKRREITQIDYHLFTEAEFLDMMKADFENVGKQIYKYNIIYHGYINYCSLLKRI